MRHSVVYIILLLFVITGCKQIDVQENIAEIPRHEWFRNHKVVVELDIKDSAYQNIFFVLRHSEKFKFTNILSFLTIRDTAKGSTPVSFMHLNIPLTDASGNWLGNQLNDLYYHRVKINQPVFFKPGRYQFILQHEMKDNPLNYVLNAGVAVEKNIVVQ